MLSEPQVAFLEAARVGYLGTVDAQGRPRVVPVCFALVGGEIYSPIDQKPKRTTELARIKHVRARPDVCLTVDHWDEDWSKLAWLQVRGLARVVEATPEVVAALRRRYPPYRAMALEIRPLLAIRVREVVGWSASSARAM